MTLGIVCTVALGVIALWLQRRVAHWVLVAKVLGRDVVVERAKRAALALALADVAAGLARGDAQLCAQAMRVALDVANDDSDGTLVKLGYKLPEKIR